MGQLVSAASEQGAALIIRPSRSLVRWAGLSLPQLWAFLAVALPVLGTLAFPTPATDLAYQLRAGEMMLDQGTILRSDEFSFTASGEPWLDQQWGSQVLLASVFRLGGWAGLGAARIGLVALVFLFVYLACRSVMDRRWAAWLTLGSFVLSISGAVNFRPQLLGMALFGATLWIVLGRDAHPGRLWAIPVLTVIWANLHGSFFLAPILLGLAWIEDRHRRSDLSGRVLATALLSLLATLVNPFGPLIWPYAAGLATDARVTQNISEWQPTTVRSLEGAIFFLSAAVVVVLLSRRSRPIPWPKLIFLGTLFALGLVALRGTIWWGLAMPPIVAGTLGLSRIVRGHAPRSLINTGLAAAVVAGVVVGLLNWLGGSRVTAPPNVVGRTPTGLTAALDRELEPGERVFNRMEWGSWFVFALPDNPIFVDPRIEVFSPRIWDDYDLISQGREGWQEALDRWKVEAVAAHREQQEGLIPRIRQDLGWRLIHEDREGLVFVRAP